MSREPAIEVDGVGKSFRLHARGRTLKSACVDWVLGRGGVSRDFWALRGVTFNAARGESLGIIGENGAGKSTLLALIAGTMLPTEGTIRSRGTISSLLELGAGFHPDLSGRENVMLYGAIMGIPREQMTRRMDAIVDFAGLREWIDEPVRHYSSGMYVRLGFSVAVEVDPDILLVDEVLAVGDVAFQRKCMDRMAEFRQAGKTMLIISHSLPTIEASSDRVLFLDAGRVLGLGEAAGVVNKYELHLRRKEAQGAKRVWGTQEVVIEGVRLLDAAGQPSEVFRSGGPLAAEITYRASRRIEHPVFGFAISDTTGHVVYGNNTQIERHEMPFIDGKGMLRLEIPVLGLARGSYLASFSIHSADHRVNYYRMDHAFPLTVECDKSFEGCYMPCRWIDGH